MFLKHKYSEGHKVVEDSPHNFVNGGACYDDGGSVDNRGVFTKIGDYIGGRLSGDSSPASPPPASEPEETSAPTKARSPRVPVHNGKSYDEIVSEAETGKEGQ